MNYYPYHIGDYARDTGHLSMLEHGAYRQMLDIYYATEKPLPLDRERLYRLTRANSKAERAAVDSLLSEFFTEKEDGWHHKRCDVELAKSAERSEKARQSALASVAKRSANEQRTLSERSANVELSKTKTKTKTKLEEEERSRATRFDLPTLPSEWEEFCRQERPDLTPQKTFEKFSDYWRAKPGKEGTKLDWLATWRNWVRAEKKQGATHGTNITRAKQLETSNRAAISNWLRDAEAAERSGGGTGPDDPQHALSESGAHRGSGVGVSGGVQGVERRPAQARGQNILPESRTNLPGDKRDRADTQVQFSTTQTTPF